MLKDNTLEKMVNAFNRNYDFLYKEEERNDVSVHTLVNTLAEEYDALLQNDDFTFLVRLFNNYRNDFISSDREAAAYMMTREQLILG